MQSSCRVTAEATNGEAALRRAIGVGLGALLAVNATIGTGIFRTPSTVVRQAGSVEAALAVWLGGAVLAVAGALSVAELGAAMPRAGGLYEYLRRAYGPRTAFLFGWTKLTLLTPSATGSFAKLSAEATAALLDLPPSDARDAVVALAILGGCAGANLVGVRAGAAQQGALTALKYGGVLALAALGAVAAPAPPGVAVAASPSAGGLLAALVTVMWAYDGWADLSLMAGEVEAPGRTLPRALLLGATGVAVAYLAVNLSYARVLGLDGLLASTSGSNMAAANLATRALGPLGARLLAGLLLVSCVGGCMASLLTGSRVLVPMATDGLLPGWLGSVSARAHVPSRAVALAAALGGVYVASRTFEELTDGFVVGYFPFYGLAVAAVFVLRRRAPSLERPFRVPGYPVVPGLFVAAAAAIVVGAVARAGRGTWLGLALLLVSAAAVRASSRRGRPDPRG